MRAYKQLVNGEYVVFPNLKCYRILMHTVLGPEPEGVQSWPFVCVCVCVRQQRLS